MKKSSSFLCVVLLFACVCCGCFDGGYVKVTFKQDGFADVVRNIPYGEDATGIPVPNPVKGYTVTWEDKDLTSLTSDVFVYAVLTPNKYTVTFDPNGGYCSKNTEIFTYGFNFSLPNATKSGCVFVGWYYGETRIVDGAWEIDDNITLVAKWADAKEYVNVTFRQDGFADVVVQTLKGTAPQLPVPHEKKGYTVVWQDVDWANVTSDIVVNALSTANKYTITYNLGDKTDAAVSSASQEVTYDAAYRLLVATCDSAKFVGWRIDGSDEILSDGVWNIDRDVTLIAVWLDEGWTDLH